MGGCSVVRGTPDCFLSSLLSSLPPPRPFLSSLGMGGMGGMGMVKGTGMEMGTRWEDEVGVVGAMAEGVDGVDVDGVDMDGVMLVVGVVGIVLVTEDVACVGLISWLLV